MILGWPQWSYFVRSALRGLSGSPLIHGVAILVLTLALFATGLAAAAVRSMEDLLAALSGNVELTLYIEDDASTADVEAIEAAVRQQVGNKGRRVSSEQARSRLSAHLGELGGTLEGLSKNPLPQSLEVSVPPEKRTTLALAEMAASLQKISKVSGVDYGAAAVERLAALSSALRLLGLVAFLMVAFTSVVITAATLQLAVYARRDEIEIQKLVGATDLFVKAPFLLEGLAQGFFAALLSSIALWVFASWTSEHVTLALGPFFPKASLHFDWPRVWGQVFISGMALGFLGSAAALSHSWKT